MEAQNTERVHGPRIRGAKMTFRRRLLTRFVPFLLPEPEQREPSETGWQAAPGRQAGWLWPAVSGVASRWDWRRCSCLEPHSRDTRHLLW